MKLQNEPNKKFFLPDMSAGCSDIYQLQENVRF